MATSDVPPRSGGITVQLPFDQGAARTARELVDELLAELRADDELRQDAALVVHELVINAVRHGRPDPQGRIEFSGRVVGGRLVVAVVDCGRHGQIVVRPPNEESASGRGLAIVAALSDSWSVDRSEGTRVSATLAL
jgi:serine/threonine-protein kinase RsbW